MGCLLGIDIGTQSLKVVILDEALAVLGEASIAYSYQTPQPGWAEQDPTVWMDAMPRAIGQALASARIAGEAIAGIGVTGQLDGCIAMDAGARPQSPCLIWMDRRATDLPALDAAAFATSTGQVMDAGHMAAKIKWLRAAAVAQRLPPPEYFHQPVSFVVEQLCGARVMDHCLASTTMLYDIAARAWAPWLLSAFEIDAASLPRIATSTDVAGKLSPVMASRLGLVAQTPVVVGTGDDFATPLGGGMAAPGRVACVVGTAEVVGAVSSRLVVDQSRLVETHPFFDDQWFIENPGWLSGGSVTWLSELIGWSPERMDDAAQHMAMGAEGLVFLPALSGAMAPRWHAGARGCFYGLTTGHQKHHMVRAVFEAMAFAARDVMARLGELAGPIDDVLLLGGGNSAVWAQIRADITGLPHAVAARSDTAAVGAGMMAAVGIGAYKNLARAAQQAAPVGAMFHPNHHRAAQASEAYARYLRLFATLEPIFGM